jgi:nucleoside-triphosphatase THEP1
MNFHELKHAFGHIKLGAIERKSQYPKEYYESILSRANSLVFVVKENEDALVRIVAMASEKKMRSYFIMEENKNS